MSEIAEQLRLKVKDEIGTSSMRGFAVRSGLRSDVLHKFVKQGHEPRLGRAAEICRAVGLDLYIGYPPRDGMTSRTGAEPARSSEAAGTGQMETMHLTVDGIIHHARQLKVHHPDRPGKFATAVVRDPAFDSLPNIYTEAASKLGRIRATVEISRRTRTKEIQAIYVLEAEAVEEEASPSQRG